MSCVSEINFLWGIQNVDTIVSIAYGTVTKELKLVGSCSGEAGLLSEVVLHDASDIFDDVEVWAPHWPVRCHYSEPFRHVAKSFRCINVCAILP